jgi:hypothetical protein
MLLGVLQAHLVLGAVRTLQQQQHQRQQQQREC